MDGILEQQINVVINELQVVSKILKHSDSKISP